jgi:hypothetical protein
MRISRMSPVHRRFLYPLLLNSFHLPTGPLIPDDDDELWLLADADSIEEWKQVREKVLAVMVKTNDAQGKQWLSHPILDADHGYMSQRAEERKASGSKGGKAKAAKSSGDEPAGGTPDDVSITFEDIVDGETKQFQPEFAQAGGLIQDLISDRFGDGEGSTMKPSAWCECVQAVKDVLDGWEQCDTDDLFDWLSSPDTYYSKETFKNCKTPLGLVRSFVKNAEAIRKDYERHVRARADSSST